MTETIKYDSIGRKLLQINDKISNIRGDNKMKDTLFGIITGFVLSLFSLVVILIIYKVTIRVPGAIEAVLVTWASVCVAMTIGFLIGQSDK